MGKDWLRAQEHHLCLTNTLYYCSYVITRRGIQVCNKTVFEINAVNMRVPGIFWKCPTLSNNSWLDEVKIELRIGMNRPYVVWIAKIKCYGGTYCRRHK